MAVPLIFEAGSVGNPGRDPQPEYMERVSARIWSAGVWIGRCSGGQGMHRAGGMVTTASGQHCGDLLGGVMHPASSALELAAAGGYGAPAP